MSYSLKRAYIFALDLDLHAEFPEEWGTARRVHIGKSGICENCSKADVVRS